LGWDYYYHCSTANLLDAGTSIASGGYTDYPSTFILLNTIRKITALGIIESAVLLSTIVRVATIVTLYAVAKSMLGKEGGYFATCLFILGNFRFSQYTQYSPQTLGLLVLLVASLIIEKEHMDRERVIALVPISLAIITIHPFSSLLLLTVTVAMFLLKLAHTRDAKKTWPSGAALIYILALWSAWQVFAATNTTIVYGEPLSGVFVQKINFLRLIETVSTFATGNYNELLLEFRRYFSAFIGVAGIAGLFLGRNDKKLRLAVGLFLGVILFSFILLFLQTPRETWLDRILLFGYVPLSVLAAHLYERASFRQVVQPRKCLALLAIIVIGVSFFASNEWTYSRSIHSWETTSANSLLPAIRCSGSVVVSDDITIIIFRFLNGTPNSLTINRHTNSPTALVMHGPDQSQNIQQVYVVRSFRQMVDWYYAQSIPPYLWSEIDQEMILSSIRMTRFYDSWFVQAYQERY